MDNQSEGKLAKNQLGKWGAIFYSVGASTPSGLLVGGGAATLIFAHGAAPLTFIIGGIIIFMLVVPMYFMSRKISTAAGYYGLIEKASNNIYAGKVTGWLHVFYTVGTLITAAALSGWWISLFLGVLFHTSLSIWQYLLIGSGVPVISVVVNILGIKNVGRTAIAFGVYETIIVVIFSAVVLIKSPFTVSTGLHPFNIDLAPSIHDFFYAIVAGAMLHYLGFGAVVNAGEEAKLSHKTIGLAFIVGTLIILITSIITLYAMVDGEGLANAAIVGSTTLPAAVLSLKYGGLALAVLILTAGLAGNYVLNPILWQTSASRDLFSLSRDGLLPKFVERTGGRLSPIGSLIFSFFLVLGGFFITYFVFAHFFGLHDAEFYTFGFWGGAITFASLIIHVVLNESIWRFFKTELKRAKGFVEFLLIPLVGTVLVGFTFYYSLVGLQYPYVLAPLMIIVVVVLGLIWTYYLKSVRRFDISLKGADEIH